MEVSGLSWGGGGMKAQGRRVELDQSQPLGLPQCRKLGELQCRSRSSSPEKEE